MSNKFYTKNGYLTQYALVCGYLETNSGYNVGENPINISLGFEGCVYHVKGYDHKNHGRICWESFDKLTDARAFFQKVLKENKQSRKINYD